MDDFPKAEYGAYAGDLTPLKAWKMLKNDASSELFDVRTDAEFSYVGRPDLIFNWERYSVGHVG
tara:strand:+ start:1535 stop:1726 length:192 start_codon:yes stop_codon:yes gene_type:complete